MTNTFLRDGAYVTDPVIKDSNATYTPGISERRSGSTRLLSHNLKSVDTQTTLTPAVSASKVYDAFGNVTASSGTFLGPFGYGGGFGYQEDATGLKLLGHRYYDSSTGRFLTRDPIKDGRNWYVYCDNDPARFADPNGLVRADLASGAAVLADGECAGAIGVSQGAKDIIWLSNLIDVWTRWLEVAVAITLVGKIGQGEGNGVPVYRVGPPHGRYWAFENPLENRDFFRDYGIGPETGNPGTTVSVGFMKPWRPGPYVIRPTQNMDGSPIGNGKFEVFIPNSKDVPRVVSGIVSFDIPPGFFNQ